jgi:acyl-CoA reductase-like NAD-dependent aldehyde dehydrogenase
MSLSSADFLSDTLSLPEEKFEDDEKIVTTRYTPLGVVGAICPWNCKSPYV